MFDMVTILSLFKNTWIIPYFLKKIGENKTE